MIYRTQLKLIVILTCLITSLSQAEDGCDLLCQLGQDPVIKQEDAIPNKNQNDSKSLTKNQQNITHSAKDTFSEKDFINLINDTIETITGEKVGEYIDYDYDLFRVTENNITLFNFSISGRERISEEFVKLFSIGEFGCSAPSISNKTFALNNMILIANPIQYYQGMLNNSSCELKKMKADFLDDPVLLYEFIEEMGLEDNRAAIILVEDLLSDIGFKAYIKSSGMGRNEIAYQFFMNQKNAFELKIEMQGLMDFYTKMINSYPEFYLWLGYSSVLEYKQYFENLSTEEIINESVTLQEYYAEYMLDSVFYDEPSLLDFLYGFDIKKSRLNIMWSDNLLNTANQMSDGQVDFALSLLKPYAINKMSKYEITDLLMGGLGPEITRALVNIIYPIYEKTHRELQTFLYKPKGIGFLIANDSNVNLYDIIMSTNEPTPMELIRLLSGLRIEINANPNIRK